MAVPPLSPRTQLRNTIVEVSKQKKNEEQKFIHMAEQARILALEYSQNPNSKIDLAAVVELLSSVQDLAQVNLVKEQLYSQYTAALTQIYKDKGGDVESLPQQKTTKNVVQLMREFNLGSR